MKITFCGAAGEVTGSSYLVETRSARVLVDFGLFQGRGATDAKNRNIKPINPKRLDAVVLTHAHLDHCGRLPILARRGYRGPIHATAATADLAQLILLDSAHIQQEDTNRLNRRRERQNKPLIEPLYSKADAESVHSRFNPIAYGERRDIADGVSLRLLDAGHMLGSASVELTLRDDNGKPRILVFSGDIGTLHTPMLRDPTTFDAADLVVLESTYGDRDHRPLDQTLVEFLDILKHAVNARQLVLIPSFAIGRSHQILYHLAEFIRDKSIPSIPIFLDSPMAIDAVAVYRKHTQLFDQEARQLVRDGNFHHDLASLHLTRTPDESRQINNVRDAAVVIAASGMCEGGRILHHLKHNLWRSYVNVVFVGFQASGTLGERIVHGAKQVKIFGEPISVQAKIHTLGGFSGHAGQSELLDWFRTLADSKPRVVLTHGEPAPRDTLADKIQSRHDLVAHLPQLGEVLEF